MNKLLPKYDYFKHTTRRILSAQEKREMIDATERAAGRLRPIRLPTVSDSTTFEDARHGFQIFRMNMRTLDRCISLIKGLTQPRRLYRRIRRFQVETEARRIALETGAKFEDVQRAFMNRLDNFVSDEP